MRHALTPATGRVLPGRAPGPGLSEVGRRQALAVSRRLGALRGVAAVYASPLRRARETALPIARARGVGVTVARGLTELDVGAWTGWSLARARRRPEWATIQRAPGTFRFPGGESFAEMQARMAATVSALAGRHRGRIVVAVSHADPIKALVALALGVPLDLFQRIVVAPAAVTALAWGPAPAVLTLNSVDGDLAWLEPP